jgi:hypothetical protein
LRGAFLWQHGFEVGWVRRRRETSVHARGLERLERCTKVLACFVDTLTGGERCAEA